MVAEGGAHVVVNLEPVRHVDVEPFFLELGEGASQVKVTGQLQPPPQSLALPEPHAWEDANRAPLGTGKYGGPRKD